MAPPGPPVVGGPVEREYYYSMDFSKDETETADYNFTNIYQFSNDTCKEKGEAHT